MNERGCVIILGGGTILSFFILIDLTRSLWFNNIYLNVFCNFIRGSS